DAGGSWCPPGDRGRAPRGRRPPEGARAAPRARPPGVRAERGPGGLRGHVHLALGDRGGSRRGDARRSGRRGTRACAGDLARAGRRSLRHAECGRVRRVRARALRVIVRWGLDELPEMLGGRRPFLLATERWEPPVGVAGRWSELPTDEEIDVG